MPTPTLASDSSVDARGPATGVVEPTPSANILAVPLSPDEQRFATFAQGSGWKTDFEKRTVLLTEIFSGGVPRDGIPPIDNPEFVAISDGFGGFDPQEPVIAIELNGDDRACPLRILQRHEIVNDVVGNEPVTVTFCPLCNSSVAFERTVAGEVRRFGVSGFLRNSDLVMWDDTTQSLWQQLTGEAIVGEMAGSSLTLVSVQTVSLETFAAGYPTG